MLVSGGFSFSGIQASAELFDPATRRWQNTFPMSFARFAHTSTLLTDGRVLVAGGANLDEGYVAAAEVFDPATEAWQPAGRLARARANHTASLLPDGRVLVAGGLARRHTELRSAEIYDPATNTWSDAASMRFARYHHTATTLADGRVLVAGGDRGEDDFQRSAEIYDPARNRWTRAASMRRVARQPQRDAAAGRARARRRRRCANPGVHEGRRGLQPTPRTAGAPCGNMNAERAFHVAALLPSGNVLVAGGFADSGTVRGAELFTSCDGSVAAHRAAAPRPRARVGRAAR